MCKVVYSNNMLEKLETDIYIYIKVLELDK